MKIPSRVEPLYYDPEVRAEHRLVGQTLRRLFGKGKAPYPAILQEQVKLGTPGHLTFAAMDDANVKPILPLPIVLRHGCFSSSATQVFPDGTVTIAGGRTVDGQVAHLVTDPERSAIGRAYRGLQEHLREMGESRPVGMLFHFAGAKLGWILHDASFNTTSPRIIPSSGGVVRLEKYRDVLAAIASGDRGIVRDAEAAAAAVSESAAIAAAIHKRFGHGTAARLALFLAAHQVDQPTPEQQQRIQCLNGEFWLVMSGPQLAQAVDAKPRSVQAAVVTLKNQGVLQVHRGGFNGDGCRNGYWVDIDALLAGDTTDIEESK